MRQISKVADGTQGFSKLKKCIRLSEPGHCTKSGHRALLK